MANHYYYYFERERIKYIPIFVFMAWLAMTVILIFLHAFGICYIDHALLWFIVVNSVLILRKIVLLAFKSI